MFHFLFNLFKPTEIEVSSSNSPNIPIVYIHGANCSHLSFRFIKSQLSDIPHIDVNYTSSNGFFYNLEAMANKLKDIGPVMLVGHSLGGLYALHLTEYIDVIAGVSISTPFKGSGTADWARYMVPSYQLFKDIGRRSKPVVKAEEILLTIPWTQIVTTAGSVPWHYGPNDGVVTVESMKARNDMKHVYVENNHYEVMCVDTTVLSIRQMYNSVMIQQ